MKKNIKYFDDDELDYSSDKRLQRILKRYLNELLIDKILHVLSVDEIINFDLKQI